MNVLFRLPLAVLSLVKIGLAFSIIATIVAMVVATTMFANDTACFKIFNPLGESHDLGWEVSFMSFLSFLRQTKLTGPADKVFRRDIHLS